MTGHGADARGAGSPEPHTSRAWDTPLLLGATAAWGGTFVATKDAILAYSAAGFLAGRFGLAALALAPLARRTLTRRTLAVGAGIGLVLAFAYALQTLGLRSTTPTNAGLISGFLVVSAPLADHLLFRVRARRSTLAAGALSVAGLTLLTGGAPAGPTGGDGLVLLSTAAFGVYVALLSRFAAGHDARALTCARMLAVATVFALIWPLSGPVRFPPPSVWPALLATGIIASAGGFWAQTFVQQRMPAARLALLNTMEPVFAALFGYGLAGDRLTPPQLLGGLLILSAVIAGARAGTRGTGGRAVGMEGHS